MSIFQFSGWKNKFWAFRQMGLNPFQLGKVQGLQMIKFLGSGAGNGFSIKPDFSTYCMLAVWETEADAATFILENRLFAEYFRHSCAQNTHFMHNTVSHGFWDQKQPFQQTSPFDPEQQVAVITRATIKWKYLVQFWRYVPPVSQSVEGKPGLKMALGIGELPLIQQATFSIWDSGRHMMDFAYKNQFHSEVIKKTRELGWYKEELFARFVVFKSV